MWWDKKPAEIAPPVRKEITEFERAKQNKDGTWITIEFLVTPGVGWTTWHPVDLRGLSKEQVSKSLNTIAYNFLAAAAKGE